MKKKINLLTLDGSVPPIRAPVEPRCNVRLYISVTRGYKNLLSVAFKIKLPFHSWRSRYDVKPLVYPPPIGKKINGILASLMGTSARPPLIRCLCYTVKPTTTHKDSVMPL